MASAAEDFKTNLDTQIKSITDRYKPALDDLQARGQKLADDYHKPDDIGAVLGLDFDIDWKEVKIVFDLPSVTMRTKSVSMDIPEVSMQRQDIIFHTPSVRTVTKKVGQYPEFHGLNIVWKDILTDVPEVFMEEQRIAFDLPSVTMKTQDWKIDLPDFTMERQEWFVKIPQFTLKNITVETEKIKAAGEQLQEEGRQIGERMKAEINTVPSGGSAKTTQDAIGLKTQISAQFDGAITTLMNTINELVAKGIDPIKVPGANGDLNLRKQLADLIAQRDAAIRKVEMALAPANAEAAAEPATAG